MAPQLAAVVHALALTTQVQKQGDAVQEATGRERERLRRDLHDGLGPSLTVGGLGLQTLGDAVGPARPRELVDAVQREATADVGEVRRILDDLAPAALADGTSAGALDQRIAAVAGHLSNRVARLLTLRVRDDGSRIPARCHPRHQAGFHEGKGG